MRKVVQFIEGAGLLTVISYMSIMASLTTSKVPAQIPLVNKQSVPPYDSIQDKKILSNIIEIGKQKEALKRENYLLKKQANEKDRIIAEQAAQIAVFKKNNRYLLTTIGEMNEKEPEREIWHETVYVHDTLIANPKRSFWDKAFGRNKKIKVPVSDYEPIDSLNLKQQ